MLAPVYNVYILVAYALLYLTPKRSTAVSIAQTHNKLISIQLLTLLLLNNTAYNLIDTNLFVVCKYLLKLTPMTIENLFRQMKIRISNWSNKKREVVDVN